MGIPERASRLRSLRYCARQFTPGEIEDIRALIAEGSQPNRTAVAREVARRLGWCGPDGRPKQCSCSVALGRMERDGLLQLPSRLHEARAWKTPVITAASDPGPALNGRRGDLGPLSWVRVRPGPDSKLWNEVVARHHYLGYRPLTGAQMRYLVYAEQRLVAALAIASEAGWIGWRASAGRV